jgi:hypothetical protein
MPLNPEQFDELPEPLIAELRAGHGRDVRVPVAVDDAILREARAGFVRRRRFRIAVRVASSVAAAAAVVALAVMLLPTRTDRQSHQPVAAQMLMVASASAGEDVDHSGKVDVLDAFVVAKLIDSRTKLDAAYDVNGDGKVDQADVDRIAMAAVNVSTTPRGEVQ